jgi:2-phospho-L-lactate guanylyltransferase
MSVSPPLTFALVPVKGFTKAKSRLAGVLEPGARRAFAERCFDHVLTVLEEHPGVAQVLVLSSDAEVLRAARARGHHALIDPPGATRLNEIVDSGLSLVADQGATEALVLMSDLPALRSDDIDALLHTETRLADVVVIAPDRERLGTNALVLRPPERMPTCFGDPRSYRLHEARAAALGCRCHVVQRPGLAGDVDSGEDYARFSATEAYPSSAKITTE